MTNIIYPIIALIIGILSLVIPFIIFNKKAHKH